ncbi:DUF6049 family protein [Phytoactinopolyspora mesophila]|uniref:Secreted protein n=1 Tax=Phytoactinopolyspora mesophila TaxID=2650750 RepID=A0A7K3M4B2_9ACTN|nr:DUF6049 family protein [Phytoactinopolyspora mesophila]NDL57877.1 hypothetical protein [Phytoactinopolyspora mesophila]
MPGRIVLTIAAVAVVSMIFAAPAPAADRPDAQDTGATAESYLNTVEPSALAPGETLTLAGVVENTGDEPITNVQALPRWNTVQLETRDEIALVSVDDTVRWGFRYDDPFQVVAERLDPGEQAEFRLDIDAEQLSFGSPGVYTVGVDIRGSLTDGDRVTLDTARTVVPWIPDDVPAKVDVALLWPAEAPPALMPSGDLRNDAVAGRIAPGGPLDAIVDAAGSNPVTWLVDPDLLDTVDAMTESDSGDAAEAAEEWESKFQPERDGSLYLLPYARPDVRALLATDPELASQLTAASVDATRQTARTLADVRTGVARADAGADDDVFSALADAGVRTVILSGAAATSSESPMAHMSTARGELEVVLTDPGLDAVVADAHNATNTDAGLLELRQRWAAETAMAAIEAELRGAQPQPLVVAPPARWTPHEDLANAVVDVWTDLPWVEPVTVDELPAPSQPASVTVEPADAGNVLPAENVAAAADLQDAVQKYTELLADPDQDLNRALGLAAIRAASSGWRDDPAAGLEYASDITDELGRQLGEVSVTVPESVTLSSRTGIFPLTVTNELDEPVTVKLAIQSANPDRLRVDDVPEQQVGAGSRETIEIKAQAATNGRVPITVQLVTHSGAPLGPTTQSVVNATDYGTIGWIIIVGAGALFGAAVIRTMLRRRNSATGDHDSVSESAADDVATGDDPGSAGAAGDHTGAAPRPPAQGVTR